MTPSEPRAPLSTHDDLSVEIISREDSARRDLVVPPSFGLHFPRGWRPEPVKNRYADGMERATIAWLKSYGIGCKPEEEATLDKFNCGMYGGYSLPMANWHAGLLVTQFISLWLFWDDVQVEEEQGWDIDEVIAALTSPEPPRCASRYIAAWSDIGRRLQRSQSDAWLENLGATMRQWLENAKVETGMAKAYRRKGVCPELSTLFDVRTVSIGMYPTFHLIELAEGFELPDAFHRHETVVEMKRLASRLVGMGNDLGGLAKDIANRWLNLVLILQDRASTRVEDAFQRVVDIHNAEARDFDRLAASLPSWGAALDPLVEGWVQAVRYNVHGFALWESTADRYQEYRAVVGNKALIAPVAAAA